MSEPDNLKRHRPDIMVVGEGKALAYMPEDPMGVWCHIQEVRDLLDVKDRTIAAKDAEIEELKAVRKRLEEANANLEKRDDSIYNEWKALFEKFQALFEKYGG